MSPEVETEALRERLIEDTPFWAENLAKIYDKRGRLIPLSYKPGQLELDRRLEAQRAAGKPMRAIVLKARQIGFSTSIQSKIVHRCTLRERWDAVTVAHDKETGAKLSRMAETMYGNLPDDPWLKPKVGSYGRRQFMHFTGEGSWQQGDLFPDSRYSVDTAGEFQAGRGGTYRGIHASEVAFWGRINEKLTALMSAVPEDPDTLFIMETTANGFNEFKDWWDLAWKGEIDWIAFFWPWWKEPEYTLKFASKVERERFVVGDPSNRYAEEEPAIVEAAAAEGYELTLEQLNWRRHVIANKGGGDIRYFHQEYPSTPEEAFIGTGSKVFDPFRVAQVARRVEAESDPRQPTEENPGPAIGDLRASAHETHPTMKGGTLEVPSAAIWTPREAGLGGEGAPWRIWLPRTTDGGLERPSEYVVAVDPSGGKMETTDEPDYHAIQVIDHKTREQVAEYRSRIDPDLLAEQVLLAALFFNFATVGVERTGGFGMPIIRVLANEFHYPHQYRPKRVGNTAERLEGRYGWDTNVRTKPDMIAGMQALLREGTDGIRSRRLLEEMQTYTRTQKGVAEAEPGKYDDLLMAYMIAQQIAAETPMRGMALTGAEAVSFAAGRPGLKSYDARYG